jgi:ubiquinone biosynthesis protein UbiJ
MNAKQPEDSDHLSVEGDIQKVCAILESVASRFEPSSKESIAIRDAAIAYTVVQRHRSMKKSYEKLRLSSGGQLTDEMKATLRSHGIEPNDFEENGID